MTSKYSAGVVATPALQGPCNRPWRVDAALGLLAAVMVLLLLFARHRSAGPPSVVLIGDSITSKWAVMASPNQLAGLLIINRGLPGDTTAHMLARFNNDVVALQPRVIVILGGINDIAETPLPDIEKNLASMAEIAERHKTCVVLGTLPPTGQSDPNLPPSPAIYAHDKIAALNLWIRDFAASKHYSLADYHSVLTDERGFYRPGLTPDGAHPTDAGYQLMEPLLRSAVQSGCLTN